VTAESPNQGDGSPAEPGGRVRCEEARGPRRHTLDELGALALLLAALALVPWTVVLALQLPPEHTTKAWSVLWIGFDIGLATLLAATGLALRHRWLSLPLLAGATAAALSCDAWFDVVTASGDDRVVAILLAAFAELPLAFFCAVVGGRSLAQRPG